MTLLYLVQRTGNLAVCPPIGASVPIAICSTVVLCCWYEAKGLNAYRLALETKHTIAAKLAPEMQELILPEILGQSDPVGAKMPIFNRYSLVAP